MRRGKQVGELTTPLTVTPLKSDRKEPQRGERRRRHGTFARMPMTAEGPLDQVQDPPSYTAYLPVATPGPRAEPGDRYEDTRQPGYA